MKTYHDSETFFIGDAVEIGQGGGGPEGRRHRTHPRLRIEKGHENTRSHARSTDIPKARPCTVRYQVSLRGVANLLFFFTRKYLVFSLFVILGRFNVFDAPPCVVLKRANAFV